MTLRAFEGFDWTTSVTNLGTKWGSVGSSTACGGTGGRRGGGSLYRTATPSTLTNMRFSGIYPAVATAVAGFAFKIGTLPTSTNYLALGSFETSAPTGQVSFWLEGDGSISAHRGATATRATEIARSSVLSWSTDNWYFLEFKVTVDPSAGAVYVRRDAVSVISSTSLNTRNAATSVISNFYVFGGGNAGSDFYCDDFYALDTAGSVNTDFLGDVRVDTLRPTGAGNSTQWTPSAGSNWETVDETNADSATSYVESSTAGHLDLYAFGDLSHSPSTVHGVQVSTFAARADAVARSVKSKMRAGGSNYDFGAEYSLTDSYASYSRLRETSPATSSAFTASEINGAEFGVEVVS